MDKVIINTERTEMKFPVDFLSPKIMVEAIGDRETVQYMDAVPTMDYTEEDAINFLEFLKCTKNSDTELELGIFRKDTKEFIGMCTLENINSDYKVCELGYWLHRNYVGKGYMTECAKAIIQFAKEELHMKYINAYVIWGNKKSMGLLEKLGFVQKELLKNDTENKGVMVDRYWYKLDLSEVDAIS